MGAWGKAKDGMYDIAARYLHPRTEVAGGLWLGLAILLFFADTGFFGWYPATQFNVLDWQFFFARGGLEFLLDLFLAPAVLTFILIYTFVKMPYVDPKSILMKWIIAVILMAVLMFAGTFGVIIHVIFAVAFWFGVLMPAYGRDADKLCLVLILIDFFGASLLTSMAAIESDAAFQVLKNLFFFPIWLLFITFSGRINVKSEAKIFVILLIVFVLVFNAGFQYSTFRGLVRPEGVRPAEEAQEKVFGAWRNMMDSIGRATTARLEYATGGYYEGEVEKAQKEPLGVYIEDIKAASNRFYEDEFATIWATLKVKSLDEEKAVNVNISCKSDADKAKEKQMSGEVLPRPSFEIYTLEEEDLQCKFSPGQLEKGRRKISFFADFNFKTMAYLKVYFMDEERLRSMRRDNIDVFRHFGITDKDPVAKYTPGPVKVGIESKEPPIGLSTSYEAQPLFGVTLENEDMWQGKIKRINELIFYVPESMELDLYSCDADFERYPEEDIVEIAGEGHLAYRLRDSEKEKEKYRNIKDFVSFRCRVLIKPEDMQTVLGGVPFATKFFRVTADYEYGLEKSTSIEVVRAPGFNVYISPLKATAKEELRCEGSQDTQDILNVYYKFMKIDSSGEQSIYEGRITPSGDRRSVAITLPLKQLKADILRDIKEGTIIRCEMEATLADGDKKKDSANTLIVNAPPNLNVDIGLASASQGLECNGTVEDIDGDDISISWQFSEGYFANGDCSIARNGKGTCIARVPASELSAGERIRCTMTATDTTGKGTTKEDTAIVSS